MTNEGVRNEIHNAIGGHDDLLTKVKKRKLRWYGHISRSSGMVKTILQRTVNGAGRRGIQKKRWEDDIKLFDRRGVLRFPEGSGRYGMVERYCCYVICGAPTTAEVKEPKWYEMMESILGFVGLNNACCVSEFRGDFIFEKLSVSR